MTAILTAIVFATIVLAPAKPVTVHDKCKEQAQSDKAEPAHYTPCPKKQKDK